MTACIPEGNYVGVGAGRRMHYHEAGQGPAVVFVHGSGPGASGYSNFKGNFQAIAAAGFRAIVPDLLGYGYSTMTAEAQFTFGDLKDGLVACARGLGVNRATWIGNSLGGALCIQIALDHPELVERLVLMAPGGIEDREAYLALQGIRTMIKIVTSPAGVTAEGLRKILELQMFDANALAAETVEERVEVAARQPRGLFDKLVVPNLGPRLAEIRAPVLGFWGAHDAFCPPSGAIKISSACRNARINVLSECGHWVMVEKRDVFNRETIRYLRGEA